MDRSKFSGPEEYAAEIGLDLSGPVTIDELEKVFGFRPIRDDTLLVDFEKIPEKIGSIIIADSTRGDRQTGSTAGQVIWAGSEAEEIINEALEKRGFKYKLKPGDRVGFNTLNPRVAGLSFNGHSIFPGLDVNRWTGIHFIHAEDVWSHIPAEEL